MSWPKILKHKKNIEREGNRRAKAEHNAGQNFVKARKKEKNVDGTSDSSGNRLDGIK